MFYRKNSKKGFSLIELLVVIAIIGILSSVIVVSLQTSRAKARDAKRIADIESLRTALALFVADSNNNNQYPVSLAVLAAATPRVLASDDEPVGPNNGEEYSYTRSGDGLSYHLGSTLEQIELSNNILTRDTDCTSLNTDPSPFCRGFTVGVASGFNGADVAGTPCQAGMGQSTGARAVCYDVTP